MKNHNNSNGNSKKISDHFQVQYDLKILEISEMCSLNNVLLYRNSIIELNSTKTKTVIYLQSFKNFGLNYGLIQNQCGQFLYSFLV